MIVRKTFTSTQKFYYENAPCMATQDIREQKEST